MLRIYEGDQFKGSINDDLCICVHESKSTEPERYIILNKNKLYLGVYPRIWGHRSYGSEISVKEAESLIDEMYCDEREYQTYKEMGLNGLDLIKRIIQ